MRYLPKTLHIQSFHAVALENSISKASEKTLIGKASLSRHIAELEQDLGVLLFERHSNGLELTSVGEKLFAIANELADVAIHFSDLADSLADNYDREVRLSCTPGLAAFVLPEVIQKISHQAPNIKIELVSTNRPLNLLMGEADISLRTIETSAAKVKGEKICDIAYAAYASLTYLEKHGGPQNFTDLKNHNFIGGYQMGAFEKQLKKIGASVDNSLIKYRCNDAIIAWNLVVSGCGIGVSLCHNGDNEPRVERLFKDLPTLSLPIWISAYKDIRAHKSIELVYNAIITELNNLPKASLKY